MRFVRLLVLLPAFLAAQDPAIEAYKAWDAEHREGDRKTRQQALFDASGEWVAKWPDSRVAWAHRRTAMLGVDHSAELWKQVDDNLIRLSPPHTFASLAAYTRAVREGMQHARWQKLGGTEAGWAALSEVPLLPPGAPKQPNVPFTPWIALNYPLPPLSPDFAGKTTLVYLWESRCGWCNMAAIQQLYDAIKSRPDTQVIALSVDDEVSKATDFMKQKGYTFPVVVNQSYVDKLLPMHLLGQIWIVDKSGSVRLWRGTNNFNGAEKAFVEEAIYKLRQFSN